MDYQNKTFVSKGRCRLMTLAVSLFMAVGLQAQNITLKTDNAAIREVIETLQKDYGYSFSIRTSEVDVNKIISLNVTDADIKTVLDKIFASSKVSYSIEGNLISITESAPPKSKKNAIVKVQVLDDVGPVIGASVMVKGTKIGEITDIDGNATLDCGMAAPVFIEVAFLGMATQEITTTSSRTSASGRSVTVTG